MRRQKHKRRSVEPHWLVTRSRAQNTQRVVIQRGGGRGDYFTGDSIADVVKGARGMPQTLK